MFETHDRWQRFKREIEPILFEMGWVYDAKGPEVPNRLYPDLGPWRLRYRDPESGLYFSSLDALRVATGEPPRRPGVPGPPETSSDIETCPVCHGDPQGVLLLNQYVSCERCG